MKLGMRTMPRKFGLRWICVEISAKHYLKYGNEKTTSQIRYFESALSLIITYTILTIEHYQKRSENGR